MVHDIVLQCNTILTLYNMVIIIELHGTLLHGRRFHDTCMNMHMYNVYMYMYIQESSSQSNMNNSLNASMQDKQKSKSAN